ncbi:MAG TPA: Gfo/Idh/MocA family oxidoreductase [Acidimicrobiia bacterium]|nr:Gfo/Idh/MocA family oxidoreductase [Acidimicrobiia bacterium]
MDTPVSWGVLGAANIATEKVIPAMQRSELSRIDAIASRSPERCAAAAEALTIPTAYGSYEELLADEAIEAVYIPLPNHLHAEWTIRAAEAGKHVLCEKPLAMTAAQAGEMVAACDRAGVKLMEAFMYRLHPLWKEAMRLIDEGAIGEVRAIQSVFAYRNVDASNIRNIPEFGGGALYDIGCYAVNSSRMIFGSEPTGVKSAIRWDADFGTDIVTSAVLDFDGRHAVFTCSTQMEPDQRVAIEGTEGRLVVEIPFNIPPDLPTRLLHISGGRPPVDPHVEVHEIPAADQYTIQADAFSKAIRHATPVPTPPADAVANMAVLEQIFAVAD